MIVFRRLPPVLDFWTLTYKADLYVGLSVRVEFIIYCGSVFYFSRIQLPSPFQNKWRSRLSHKLRKVNKLIKESSNFTKLTSVSILHLKWHLLGVLVEKTINEKLTWQFWDNFFPLQIWHLFWDRGSTILTNFIFFCKYLLWKCGLKKHHSPLDD